MIDTEARRMRCLTAGALVLMLAYAVCYWSTPMARSWQAAGLTIAVITVPLAFWARSYVAGAPFPFLLWEYVSWRSKLVASYVVPILLWGSLFTLRTTFS